MLTSVLTQCFHAPSREQASISDAPVFLASLGDPGTWYIADTLGVNAGPKPGNFMVPYDVAATSSHGDIVVADTGNSRLQVLSAQGQYKRSLRLKELGGQGQTWHGHLRYPMGVAVDGSSTVAFVADTHHHRVVAMRLTDGQQVGRAVEGVGDFLSGGTKLYYPRGVTWAVIQSPMITHVASKIRVLLIADSGNHRVLCLQAYVPVQMHARTHARMHARTHARTHARS